MAWSWTWALSFGGDGQAGNYGSAVAVDDAGHVYAAGSFSGSVSFGPTASPTVLTGTGQNLDMYLVEHTTSGAFGWWARSAGALNDWVTGACVDEHGRVHVTGGFSGTATFETARGALPPVVSAAQDMYVLCCEPGARLAWAQTAKSSERWQSQAAGGVSAGKGALYVTGRYTGTATFGAAPKQVQVTSNGAADFFLAKYKADGAISWVVSGGSANADDVGASVAVDAEGCACVTGSYHGSMILGAPARPITLSSPGSRSFFVAKYDPRGALLWARTALATHAARGNAVACDAAGNVFVAGQLDGEVTFGDGIAFQAAGPDNPFLAKYDAHGRLLWVLGGVSTLESRALSLAADGAGNAYVAGTFSGTVRFPDGADGVRVTARLPDGLAVFVLEVGPDGKILAHQTVSGLDAESSVGGDAQLSLAATREGHVFVLAGFTGRVALGGDAEIACAPGHRRDVLLARLG